MISVMFEKVTSYLGRIALADCVCMLTEMTKTT